MEIETTNQISIQHYRHCSIKSLNQMSIKMFNLLWSVSGSSICAKGTDEVYTETNQEGFDFVLIIR
ncbi:hypothetical protein DN068_17025 [Taibaiella soli]|uniref:Uncharacterized protein n=1 Tax=Taibaiella soli TaxID=1649169 RepID=A0A2W2B6Z1_9BACT|nr:hypothetical protein DN068_17025 [Taibaiella soli]